MNSLLLLAKSINGDRESQPKPEAEADRLKADSAQSSEQEITPLLALARARYRHLEDQAPSGDDE